MKDFIINIMPMLLVAIITIIIAKFTGVFLRIILTGIMLLIIYLFFKYNPLAIQPMMVNLPL